MGQSGIFLVFAALVFAACDSEGKKLELRDEAREVALDLCAAEVACRSEHPLFASEHACRTLIETELASKLDFSSRCGEAAIAYERCAASLDSCSEFDDTWTGDIDDETPCLAEYDAMTDACSGYESGGLEDEKLVEPICELEMRCDGGDESNRAQCVLAYLEELSDVRDLGSEPCERALVGLLHCLSTLSGCEEFEQYWDADIGEANFPCAAKDIQVERYCDIVTATPTW